MLAAAVDVTLSVDAVGVNAADATTLYAVLRHALGGKTLTVADSAANLLNVAYVDGIDFATSVSLAAPSAMDAATATELANLHAFNAAGPAITVRDTPADLLDANYNAGVAIATTVTLDTSTTLDTATITQLAGITHFAVDAGHTITAQDSVANILALGAAPFSLVAAFSIVDTVAHVVADLDALQATIVAANLPLAIDVTDGVTGTHAIDLDAVTYAADAATIDAITNVTGIVKIADDAAALAAISTALANDPMVGEVDVTDLAANILSNLTALESIGSKFVQATITNTTVNAAEVAALLSIPNLQAGSLTISDTGSQIAAAIQANGAAGVSFMNSHTVTLSANSVIAASDAVTLEQLTNLQTGGYSLVVWDTATHLTDSVDGYLAAVKNPLITAVYLKTTGGTATITAATAATAASLLSISTFSKNNPPVSLGGNGAANVLTLLDTAAHIDSAFGALNGHTGSLSSIQVSGSATVTDAVFGDLLTLGATMAAGQSLTVRDTAATLIASAPGSLPAARALRQQPGNCPPAPRCRRRARRSWAGWRG